MYSQDRHASVSETGSNKKQGTWTSKKAFQKYQKNHMAKVWPNSVINLSKIDLDNKYETDKKAGGQQFTTYWKRDADSWLFIL